MKVIHIGTNDEGGAYQAMVRISKSMELCGAECRILLRNKENPAALGEEVCTGYRRLISRIKNFLNLCLSFGTVQSDYFGEDLTKLPAVREADVIFLHWTNSFVSYGTVRKLAKLKKPVIWVMHDMWLMTGGCHYDDYCGGYEEGCRNCPQAKNRIQKSIAAGSFVRKQRSLSELKPVIVTPGIWLKELSSVSAITEKCFRSAIHNPIHIQTFYPYSETEKKRLQADFGIHPEEKVILFSARKATRNRYKGFEYVRQALQLIDEEGYVLVVCGNDKEEETFEKIGKVRVIFRGHVFGDNKMAECYNVADTTVVSSGQESYSYSAAESLACGTPVTAFRICELPKLIRHKETGYLADFGDVGQLSEGIRFCCKNSSQMADEARQDRLKTNSPDNVGKQYLELCRMQS